MDRGIATAVTALAILSIAGSAGAGRFEEEQLHAAAAIENAMAMAEPPEITGEEGSGDSRLPDHERVFGVVVGGEPRAYALRDLRRAGGLVSDVVGGTVVWIEVTDDGATAITDGVVFEGTEIESWALWSARHRDTSLWRWSGAGSEPSTQLAADVHIDQMRSYGTGISCALSQSQMSGSGQGLFVISGVLTNGARRQLHHVLLRYELLDEQGHVVYREDGYNRAAEALFAAGEPDAGEVAPISAGASDTFRMILVSSELPSFETARVQVAAVY